MWHESVVVDAGVCGVGMPLLLFVKKNVVLDDLKLPHIASAQVTKMPSWAQCMAQALCKDELFWKGRERHLQTAMAAGLDGHLAMHNIVCMSRQHPLSTELAIQLSVPQHKVPMHLLLMNMLLPCCCASRLKHSSSIFSHHDITQHLLFPCC